MALTFFQFETYVDGGEKGEVDEKDGGKKMAMTRMTELELQSKNRADNKSFGPCGVYMPYGEDNKV